MDRSSFLLPLLVFIVLNVGLDAVVGFAVLTSEPHRPDSPWHLILIGLLWGQFGLCCGLRLRFECMRYYAYLGMFLIPIFAIAVVVPTYAFGPINEVIAIVMLTVGFTALYCLGPRSLVQWEGFENRFSLRQMMMGTLFIAFACVIAMNIQIAIVMALSIFFLAMPSVIASNLLAIMKEMTGYSWMMFAELLTCIIVAMNEPMVVPIITIYFAQIVVLWIGGLLLISVREESVPGQLTRLPEE